MRPSAEIYENDQGYPYIIDQDTNNIYWILAEDGPRYTVQLDGTEQYFIIDYERHTVRQYIPNTQRNTGQQRQPARRSGGISPLTAAGLIVGGGASLFFLARGAGLLPSSNPASPDGGQNTVIQDDGYGNGNGQNNGGTNQNQGGGPEFGDESGGGGGSDLSGENGGGAGDAEDNRSGGGGPGTNQEIVVHLAGYNLNGLIVPANQDAANPEFITGFTYRDAAGNNYPIDLVQPAKDALSQGMASITLSYSGLDRDETIAVQIAVRDGRAVGVDAGALSTLNQIVSFVQGPPTRVAPTPVPPTPAPAELDLSSYTITRITVENGHATEIFYKNYQGEFSTSLASLAQNAINSGMNQIALTIQDLDGRLQQLNLPVDGQGVTQNGINVLNQVIARQNYVPPTAIPPTAIPASPVILDMSNDDIIRVVTSDNDYGTAIVFKSSDGVEHTQSLVQYAQAALDQGQNTILFKYEDLDGRVDTFELAVTADGVTPQGVNTIRQVILRQNSELPTNGALTWLAPQQDGTALASFVDSRPAQQRDPAELEAARNPLPETMKIAAAAAKRSYAPKV